MNKAFGKEPSLLKEQAQKYVRMSFYGSKPQPLKLLLLDLQINIFGNSFIDMK